LEFETAGVSFISDKPTPFSVKPEIPPLPHPLILWCTLPRPLLGSRISSTMEIMKNEKWDGGLCQGGRGAFKLEGL